MFHKVKAYMLTKGLIASIFCVFYLVTTMVTLSMTMEKASDVTRASSVDLNTLLLNKFDEYLAWLTRYSDLNGTIVDLQDYSDVTKKSRSTPLITIGLTYLYEKTSNAFYLAYLRTIIDGAIDNSDNYITCDVGEIFYASSFIVDGVQSPDTAVMPTAYCGYASTKLYEWTSEARYETLADRIADESLNKLAVVNNSTDLAWSCSYFQKRDLERAKGAVNRQASMAVFYAAYGKTINSTYTQYVQRIIHWTWRAQIDNGGLEYTIGLSGAVNYPYTAYAIFHALEAYRIDPTIYDTTTKEKIANATASLRDDRACMYSYLTCYSYAGAFGKAWQLPYFKDYINVTNTKAIIYTGIESFHLTEKGFTADLSHTNYGFRWSQHFLASFFNAYPLSNSTYDKDTEGIAFYAMKTANGKYQWRGFMAEIIDTDLDAIQDGKSGYGVMIKASNYRVKWTAGYMGVTGLTSTVTNYTHYQKISAEYTKNRNITAYLYPIGLYISDIEGTSKTSEMLVTNLDKWRIAVENGTSWQLNNLTTGSYYKFDNQIMIWYNATKHQQRTTIMVKAENDTWGYHLNGVCYLNTTGTNYRLIYYVLAGWGAPEASSVSTQAQAFSALKSIVDDLDKAQPLSFDDMWDTYHNKISEMQPDASWKSTYQSAQNSEPKLIGHNAPQEVSITSWSYSESKLTYSILGSDGKTSTYKIYCGDKGEPIVVIGAMSWSYNSETKILTINVLHDSSKKIMVYFDEHTPPTTVISLSGVLGNKDWFISEIAVTLSAMDDLSGVDRTEYSFDNDTWNAYTMPFTIGAEGYTIIYYKSTDKVGNAEIIKNKTIKIDKTAPLGSININNGDTYTTSTSVALTLTATDATSDVYRVRLSNDGVWDTEPWEEPSTTKTWTLTPEDGTKTVHYQIKDNAGLVSDSYPDKIILDTIPPTGLITIAEGSAYTNSSSLALTLLADDATSGVAEMRFSNDGITWSLWETYAVSKSWALTTVEGIKTVYVQYRDNAGLVSDITSDTITLDTLQPSIAITSPSNGSEIKSSSITIDWTGSDTGSGIDLYEIRHDNGEWINVGMDTTYTFTALSDGSHTAEVRAIDKTGKSQVVSISFTVNTSPLFGPSYMEEVVITAAMIMVALGTAVYLVKSRKKG